MTFKSIAHSVPSWLTEDGPSTDIVISSRARLARNIEGFRYTHKADDEMLAEIASEVADSAKSAGFKKKDRFDIDDLDDIQKNVLIERHIISPALARNEIERVVLVKPDEYSSVMINEEDHLRIQYLQPGFAPEAAMNGAKKMEAKLASELRFSFSEKYGFLTACPTNLGTGLRVSVLIHLPALVLTNEIQKVVRSAGQLDMTVRGYRGEGTDVIGNLFQISNRKSFGRSGQQISDDLVRIVDQIIEYESKAADILKSNADRQLQDKIWRSVGVLKTARMLSTHEFMNLVSAVRLGLFLSILKAPTIKTLNELMITTQPGHIQERTGSKLEPVERDNMRAEMVRERFVDVSI